MTNNEEVPDYYFSDNGDIPEGFEIKEWAEEPLLGMLLRVQRHRFPEYTFGPPRKQEVDLEKVFN